MQTISSDNSDISHDDMKAIRSLKGDLGALIRRIDRLVASGILASVDRDLLATRCMGMEMYLDEILSSDWDRLTSQLGIKERMPRSVSKPEPRMLRVPTNPATYLAMGMPL